MTGSMPYEQLVLDQRERMVDQLARAQMQIPGGA